MSGVPIVLKPGLYEKTVSRQLRAQLDSLGDEYLEDTAGIDSAEASRILAKYASDQLVRALDDVKNLDKQVDLVNRVIATMRDSLPQDDAGEYEGAEVDDSATQLLSLVSKRNSVYGVSPDAAHGLPRPVTSLAGSSLFTGANKEPQLYTELNKEIASADEIDLLVSFVKWSGLRLILEHLKTFVGRGGKLRVIATTYMSATDANAIEELCKLPNTQVKISYDTERTRLHAKAYLFRRNTGYTTAYVGSSNISRPAMTEGLEWNLKIAKQDQPDVLEKVEATFESYWNSPEFELFDLSQMDRLYDALAPNLADDDSVIPLFDVRPYPFQQEILDRLEAEREVRNHWRNLVVAATGTGKTVISAFDYRRFCESYNDGKRIRMLFVAHREEILKQARATFRGVLRDQNFGELFVGGRRPKSIDHLFISIQSLNSSDLTQWVDADFYDYIVVDETHHLAAKSYQRALEYFKPQVLLGLTATPERMDGQSILPWFDNRIAAEIRLPEAIDRKLLCPFQYFGVTDSVDLSGLRWTRGGYETKQLDDLFVFTEQVARRRLHLVADAVRRYMGDMSKVKGLGFCVSKEHAKFMAKGFSELGIPSIAVISETSDEVRSNAKERLTKGDIRFIFTVDIYNEGVDIPEVNTVLFLRPTDSLTIFVQQLGRGLRLSEGKDCLTVLDFIGQANKHFSFERKFRALLTDPGANVGEQLRIDFTSAPKGCYIQLEPVAKEYVLSNINAVTGYRSWLVERISELAESLKHAPTLGEFLRSADIDLHVLYNGRNSYSRLCAQAGLRKDFADPDEEAIAKAFARICDIDSRRWIMFLREFFSQPVDGAIRNLTPRQERMLRMLQVTIFSGEFGKDGPSDLSEFVDRLVRNETLLPELLELLGICLDRIEFVDEPVTLGFDCPLDLHCSYSRDQLLVALDYLTPGNVREGVKWLPEKEIDVLMVTLDKSDKDYSPTTMYKDYSINERLFHWQSQNKTSERSSVGKRYINHETLGTKVVLFVREKKAEHGGAAPYTFLGLVDYVSHEGEKPMNIIWRLHRPIPARFIKKTNRLAS